MALDRVTLDDIKQLAFDANEVFRQVKDIMAQPKPRKTAPTFSMPYIAELCDIDRTKFRYLSEKHGLPYGTKVDGAKTKEFSLADVIAWVQSQGKFPKRPKGKKGKILTVANYKGGVLKSSLSMAMAQAFTLRGQKVLVVDCDPQGSTTQLTGMMPEDDVTEEQTVMPYLHQDQPDLRYAVQESYWKNLSIIPACSEILAAEFVLPSFAARNNGVPFWHALRNGLAPLQDEFDIIVIDTSPSLSYLTINAMLTADALMMPCPPESLDFASSVQFWRVFSTLVDALNMRAKGDPKTFDFISVIYTKVKSDNEARMVKGFMDKAYGRFINTIEIPDSKAAATASNQFKTIYDIPKPENSKDAHHRLKDPLDRLADFALDKFAAYWMESTLEPALELTR